MADEPDEALLGRIAADGEFPILARRRRRLGFLVSGTMAAVYFGYVLLLATAPGLLRRHVAAHVTLGFPLGFAVLLVAFLLVLLHVGRSAAAIDPLQDRLLRRHGRET